MAEALIAIGSPVPESLYPTLAILLLSIGLFLTASFFIYEVTTSKFSRNVVHELVAGWLSSLFLGLGALFLLLSTGVYV
ncbi:hypothetical protein O6H91_01G003800 [Diphasiastrum complanatum]|uniref:Uncharacterized protein n=1 Tax=Diphasiastrum complanatum TaxID=34168 RepID=A0ACC2EMS4_DIPCM|nr:hypothetical protein O6H91_01G003800 [Diphasiastrum complanatum]